MHMILINISVVIIYATTTDQSMLKDDKNGSRPSMKHSEETKKKKLKTK